MVANFLEISGYEPKWISDPGHFCSRHEEAFGTLLGQRVGNTWTLWDTANDEHLADAPVILAFGSAEQVEVCCWKSDELSVTYNTIDVSRSVEWPGPRHFEWRRNALVPLAAIVGSTLHSVNLIEIELVIVGTAWCLGGLEFSFDDSTLAIFNGLDDTQVAEGLDPGPGWRKRAWLPVDA